MARELRVNADAYDSMSWLIRHMQKFVCHP